MRNLYTDQGWCTQLRVQGEPDTMFTRQQGAATQDEVRPAAAPPLRLAPSWGEPALLPEARPEAALIPAGASIEGTIRSAGLVQVGGSVTGEIRCETLCIEAGARVTGTVAATSVTVLGLMRGRIEAEVIEVAPSAELEAELSYLEIAVARGARVSGNFVRRVAAPAAQPAEPKPAQGPAAPPQVVPSIASAAGAVIGLDELKTRLSQVYSVGAPG